MKILARLTKILLSAAAISCGVVAADAALLTTTQPSDTQQSITDSNSTVILAANNARYRDGSYTGSAFDAYYGMVQVRANVQGGRLVSVDVLQYPKHSGTSRSINRQALPILESAVIRAQGTRVNIVSGATLTSKAYLRSLKGALGQAGA